MPALKDLIRGKDVHPQLFARTKPGALAELSAGLADHPGILSLQAVRSELESKADSLNTTLEGGVWLPHLRSPNVRGIVICGGSWSGSEPAGPEDAGLPPGLRLGILILAQQGLVTEYLAAVGELARHLSRPGAVERIAAAASPAEWIQELLG